LKVPRGKNRKRGKKRNQNSTHQPTKPPVPLEAIGAPSPPKAEEHTLRTIFFEEWAKPTIYITIIGIAVTGYFAFIASNRSKEQLAIQVSRVYGTETFVTNLPMPAFSEKWVADITNLSDAGITIYPPTFVTINTIDHSTGDMLPPYTAGQEPDKPIDIPPRGTYRAHGNTFVQLPSDTAKPFTELYSSPTFEEWKDFTKARNLDDLGFPANSGANVVTEVLVKAVDGKEFNGEGYWYPNPNLEN
jgi:hypothetical protein